MHLEKLAYVVTQSELGGAQKNILLLSRGISDRFDITVYCGPGGLLVDELKKSGIKVIEVPTLQRQISLIGDLRTYLYLKKEFVRYEYSIVHSHSSKAGLIARLAARSAGIRKNIYTAHGFVFTEPMGKLTNMFYTLSEKLAASIATDLIVVSERDLEVAEAHGIRSKNETVCIQNGIDFAISGDRDPKSARSELRSHLGLAEEDFVFGMIANFYETKGHRYLVKAFEMLRLEMKSDRLKLVLVGQGELQDEIRSISGDGVTYTGYVENAESLMDAFDCLVLSSVKEGFPFVILEAVKHRLPIVATDVGDISKTLGQCTSCRIVRPANVNNLYLAMRWVLENKEKVKSSAAGTYEAIESKYSLQRMIEDTLMVYKR